MTQTPLHLKSYKDLNATPKDKDQNYPKSCGSSDVQNLSETLQDLDAIPKDEDQSYPKSCKSLDVRNPSKHFKTLMPSLRMKTKVTLSHVEARMYEILPSHIKTYTSSQGEVSKLTKDPNNTLKDRSKKSSPWTRTQRRAKKPPKPSSVNNGPSFIKSKEQMALIAQCPLKWSLV